jgi:hypothetical protein
VTISQTWDAGTNVMTALKVVATDTASGATSNLLELWSGSTAALKAYVAKAGHYVSANTTANDLFTNGRWIIKAAGGDIGLSWSSGGTGGTTLFNGSSTASLTSTAFSVLTLGFSTSPTAAPADVLLTRDGAANTLALRNGAAAQTFNVYGTYTSGSVYERMFARYDGTALAFQVGTQHVGASARPLQLLTDNTARMTIGTTGNVGIGTTAPAAPLHVQASAIAGREDILKCTVSDAGNNAFHIYNGSGNNTVFAPAFSGSIFANTSNAALTFAAQTTAASDSGTAPLMYFQSRITDSETNPNNGTFSAVSTRPLFAWANLGTVHMQMSANGNVGIGTTAPSSKLQVTGGDVEIGTVTSGIIMKAAGTSTRYRITLNATGDALVFTAV